VERVAVDLDVATDRHIAGGDEFTALVDILVLFALEELAFDDARVFLGGLVDRDGVVREVERDNESAVNVLGHACVVACGVTQNLLVVIDTLEEVSLRLLRNEPVDVAERVDFVTEAVVRRDLNRLGIAGLGVLHLAQLEVLAIFLHIELLRVLIHTSDAEKTSECVDRAVRLDFVASKVAVANEVLAGLVHVNAVGQLLSAQEQSERVAAIVCVMNFTDFNGVVGQVVVNDEGQIFKAGEESQYLSVMVKELLLRGNLAATEALLKELLHLVITLRGNGLL